MAYESHKGALTQSYFGTWTVWTCYNRLMASGLQVAHHDHQSIVASLIAPLADSTYHAMLRNQCPSGVTSFDFSGCSLPPPLSFPSTYHACTTVHHNWLSPLHSLCSTQYGTITVSLTLASSLLFTIWCTVCHLALLSLCSFVNAWHFACHSRLSCPAIRLTLHDEIFDTHGYALVFSCLSSLAFRSLRE